MGYFASGWPKVYRLPSRQPAAAPAGDPPAPPPAPPPATVAIAADPTGRLLLSVTPRALYVWSARHHRVLRGRFTVGATATARHGPLVAAVWRPVADGRPPLAAAAFRSGRVVLLEAAAVPLRDGRAAGGMLAFRADGAGERLAAPDVVHPLVLRVRAEAWVGGGTGAVGTGADATVTCVAEAPAGVLVGTSAGHLACVAWDGAAVLWRSHLPELLRMNDALRKLGVLRLHPDGPAGPVADLLAAAGADDGGGVATVAYDPALGFCGVVLGSGCALLLSLRRQGGAPPSAVDGRWLRDGGAASITLESRRMLATVGLRDGDVEQYYVGVPAGDVCPVVRRLSLSSWYFEPADVGAATVVSWTRDGGALLVGWEKRGLAVWSVSGCRLMWTLPQVGGILPSTPGGPHKAGAGGGGEAPPRPAPGSSLNHPMEQGVASAAWGPEGLFLWAAPRVTPESPSAVRECHFMEFSFYKSTAGASSCQSEASRLAMLGPDRVLLLASSDGFVPQSGAVAPTAAPGAQQQPLQAVPLTGGGAPDAPAGGETAYVWQHIMIPHDYLWHNWPPTRIAINDDASHIAVAGQYGVGICSVRSQRWRVFGDLSHDSRRIKCCALAWVGSSVVIGNEVESFSRARGPPPSTFELLVFPRDQIESSAVQARRALPTRPLIIDVRADGYLLIICEDSSVVLYKLTQQYGGATMEMREVYRVSLPTRETVVVVSPTRIRHAVGSDLADTPLPSPGGGISVARIFPPLDHAGRGAGAGGAEAPIPTQIMLLRNTGSLILLDVKHMLSVPLLRHVEHFWYTSAVDPPFETTAHRPVWWAYGDDGTHVCFREGMRRFLTSPSDSSREPVNPSGDPDVTGAERLAAMSPLSKVVPASLRASASSRSSGIGVEQWFELDAEVYPLGIMSKQGMLLGASQGLLANSAAMDGYEVPSHVIQVKRQPVLHTLLRHLLMKPVSDDRVALQVALKCSSQPQFVDSLEWLLHEAVVEHDDDDAAAAASRRAAAAAAGGRAGDAFPEAPVVDGISPTASPGSRLFARVIRLLKYFGQYEDIVVRCARKMDSKRWPLLFAHAGDPLALLDQCFASGRLRTAACLLVILQEMWGFASSTPQSIRLFGAALDRGEIGLAGDLANFLGKAARAGMLDASQLQVSEDVSWIAAAALGRHGGSSPVATSPAARWQSAGRGAGWGEAEGPARIPAVDLAVLQHAEALLREMDVRKLAALSIRMEFPLAAWLGREVAARVAAGGGAGEAWFVEDFGLTLLRLHRQFQYPEPSVGAVRRALERLCVPGAPGRGAGDWAGEDVYNNTNSGSDSSGSSAPPATALNGNGNGVDVERRGALRRAGDKDGDWRRRHGQSPRAFVASANKKMAGSGADNLFGSVLPPPPSSNESEQLVGMRAKARHLCEQELIYLLTVAETAGAADLCVLFGALLLDVGVLVDKLGPRLALRQRVLAALRGFGADGYDALADAVEAYVADEAAG